jgi:predicted outer membrane repeat protein
MFKISGTKFLHAMKIRNLMALLAVLGLLALPIQSYAAGTIVYVDAGASGAGDGSSWADAYPSLADDLANAAFDTEIWVAAGTYKPTSGTDRTATFQLKDGVAIYGGFAGNETQRNQRDWQTNVTTLSGDLLGNDSGAVDLSNPTRADNSYSVVTGATGAILDGVTVTGGHANYILSQGLPSWSSGGGMYNDHSSPILTHVTFSGNTSISFGGGMYNNAGNPVLTDVTFDGNYSGGNGGGLYSTGVANLTLTDVTYTGNVATDRGGGLHAEPEFNGVANLTLTNVIFSGNSATYGGSKAI